MARIQVTDEQIAAAQAGDGDAMWQIVSDFEPMLRGIIRSVAPSAGVDDVEDMLQEARATLIQHVRSYDSSSSSAQLQSYAYRTVRRVITEQWVRSSTSLTVDPTTAIRVKRALWTTEGDIEGAWMIVSSDVDPRKRLSRENFLATVEALAGVEWLDGPASGSTGDKSSTDSLADTIPDTSSDFTDPTDRRDLARWLMTQIPQRQSYALCAYFGVGMMATPDTEVCAELELKPAALRQLRARGVKFARKIATNFDIAA